MSEVVLCADARPHPSTTVEQKFSPWAMIYKWKEDDISTVRGRQEIMGKDYYRNSVTYCTYVIVFMADVGI